MLAITAFAGGAAAQSGILPKPHKMEVAGPVEVVFDHSQHACSPLNIPDAPARAIRTQSGTVHLYMAHGSLYTAQYLSWDGVSQPVPGCLPSPQGQNYRMSGPDFDHLAIVCAPVMGSTQNPQHSAFEDQEWLMSFWTADGITVHGLVHNEYQYASCVGLCSGSMFGCIPRTVTYAVSTDGGISFSSPVSPRHVVAVDPYPYPSSNIGFGEPSNIVHNPNDGYWYALTNMGMANVLGWVTAIRTNDLADPASWRAWGGDVAWGGSGQWDVAFRNPYLPGTYNPLDHIPRPLSPAQIDLMHESISYNYHLECFVLVGYSATPPANPNMGIYYAFSDDLVHWTPKQLLNRHLQHPSEGGPGLYQLAYPSLIDHDSPSMSFDISGETAYVYFTVQNPTGPLDRDLLRVPVTFTL
ncbi:MAG: hypothetical protein KF830_00235 [Planctomycetes bacterium]|nr:hypothetical protein [Planctomycetota bacterium]